MARFDMPTIDADVDTGTDLANWLNSWQDALETTHKGSGVPAYVKEGMEFLDDAGDPIWMKYIHDGAASIPIFDVDTTNDGIRFRPIAGSAADPSITPPDDTDTGPFWPTADAFAIATLGVERARFSASGIETPLDLDVGGVIEAGTGNVALTNLDGTIRGAALESAIAGDGLAFNAGVLAIDPFDNSLEFASGKLRVHLDGNQSIIEDTDGLMVGGGAAGNGLLYQTGLGRIDVSPGNGIEVVNDQVRLRSSVAGNGLGYIGGVINVGAGTGIVVNADDIAVDWASPGAIGSTTPSTGEFTDIEADLLRTDKLISRGNTAGNERVQSAYDALIGVGGTSDFRISLQDGNGRVQFYWNVQPFVEEYLVSNEPAAVYQMSQADTGSFGHGSNPGTFLWSHAPGGTAGNVISWNPLMSLNQSGKLFVTDIGLDGGNSFMVNLPTSDPGVAGQIWSSSGTLKVSAGGGGSK